MNAYKTYRQKRTSEMRPFYQFLRKTQQNVICQPVNFYRRSWEILLKASHHTGKMRYQAIMGNEEVPSHRNEWKLLIDARRVCKVSRALERLGRFEMRTIYIFYVRMSYQEITYASHFRGDQFYFG